MPCKNGNKIIDDFIHDHNQIKFFSYDQFKISEFIAEGGFSRVFKATWTGSQRNVALKKLKNSKDITRKELNEIKIYCELPPQKNINKCFGITQDPATQDFIIIMSYYETDIFHCMTSDKFYDFSWENKLGALFGLTSGLINMHKAGIIHRDLHSGNILFDKPKDNLKQSYESYANSVVISDLGISKIETELSTDDNNETYGIIPYMAPEIFHGQKYTTASDIYSFGMIMWEFMTGRRPFWNKIHNVELIIEICDGLRPPIVTNAPYGYVELMKECWHPDPKKRPTANNVYDRIRKMSSYDIEIIKSPDIGPVTMNNPGAIYKSRPLSNMIQSAMNTRSQSTNLENVYLDYKKSNTVFNGKRKFGDSLIVDNSNKDLDYRSVEIEFDINNPSYYNEYVSTDLHFDIY